MIKKTSTALLLVSSLLGNPALGDNAKNPTGPWYLTDQDPGWYMDAVIGAELEPTYAGSDQNELEPDAGVRLFYKSSAGHRYFVTLGEVGGLFELSQDVAFVAFLEYEEGRDDEDDDTLTGFEEVEDTVEGQFSLLYRFLPNTYIGGVFQPDLLGRGKGLVYFVALGNDTLFLDGKLRISTVADLSFADSEHMKTEFGVSETESDATGLDAFNIGGGVKSLSGGVSIEYYFNDHWSLLIDSELELYLGDTVDSPLIKDEGSEVTYELFAGIRYRF